MSEHDDETAAAIAGLSMVIEELSEQVGYLASAIHQLRAELRRSPPQPQRRAPRRPTKGGVRREK